MTVKPAVSDNPYTPSNQRKYAVTRKEPSAATIGAALIAIIPMSPLNGDGTMSTKLGQTDVLEGASPSAEELVMKQEDGLLLADAIKQALEGLSWDEKQLLVDADRKPRMQPWHKDEAVARRIRRKLEKARLKVAASLIEQGFADQIPDRFFHGQEG